MPCEGPSVGLPVGLVLKMGMGMARKMVVKVVLSKEQRQILVELASKLGSSESETLRLALMDYAKELCVITESFNRKTSKNEK